jgi:hypothetical protein
VGAVGGVPHASCAQETHASADSVHSALASQSTDATDSRDAATSTGTAPLRAPPPPAPSPCISLPSPCISLHLPARCAEEARAPRKKAALYAPPPPPPAEGAEGAEGGEAAPAVGARRRRFSLNGRHHDAPSLTLTPTLINLPLIFKPNPNQVGTTTCLASRGAVSRRDRTRSYPPLHRTRCTCCTSTCW